MQKRSLSIKKLQVARGLMLAAILLILVFQGYWIDRLYKEERAGLKKEANGLFRDVVYNLQVERFKADTLIYRGSNKPNLFVFNAVNAIRRRAAELKKDTSGFKTSFTREISFDSTTKHGPDKRIVTDSNPTGAGRHFVLRGRNTIPPELQAMLEKRMREGVSSVTDTVLRKIAGAPGVRITVTSGAENTLKSLPPGVIKAPLPRVPLPPPGGGQVSLKFDSSLPENAFIRMVTQGKPLEDSISVFKLDSAYKKELAKGNISLAFTIKMGKDDSLHRKDTVAATRFRTNPATVGFAKPYWYQAEFENPASFLLKKISPQILLSIFLIAFTTITFVFLYRNLAAQQRLTEMKNDFISNITHELKTPIATVSVAVEALRNFGGMQSPERTKEYLDISASELQRLGLLVDKVLKLSLFENRELEMKKESVDLKEITDEVLNTMRLQFDKHRAVVSFETTGQYFLINADRLHITSVIYNLLDNAIKYSNQNPEIRVRLSHDREMVTLEVADKGIGIADGFRDKIFEKFFRVPSGDHHNIKGYGLGLSYVAHVVKKHGGSIAVASEPGKGSTFTVKLPVV